MANIIKFNFEGHPIRVEAHEDVEWYIAKDVCEALGLGNVTAALRGLDEDEISNSKVIDSIGREQGVPSISEAGVYQLAFRSRKEAAKRFRRWLAHKVIPSIRRTGSYTAQGSTPSIDLQAVAMVVAAAMAPITTIMTEILDRIQSRSTPEDNTIGTRGSAIVRRRLSDYAKAMSGGDKKLQRSLRSAAEMDVRVAVGHTGTGRSWSAMPSAKWSDLTAKLEELDRLAGRMSKNQVNMFE